MARKRQLDPEFFKDEDMADISFEGRLYYQGTWCHCEDTGVFEVKHRTLKAQIFPYDNLETQPLYEKLRDNGKYIEYEANGAIYAFIKGFHKRQTVQYPSRSFLPLPPEPFLSLIPSKIRKLNVCSMSSQGVLTEPSSRVELSRVEKNRVELEAGEAENLSKLFSNNKDKIKNHLKTRGIKEERISEILKQYFPKAK